MVAKPIHPAVNRTPPSKIKSPRIRARRRAYLAPMFSRSGNWKRAHLQPHFCALPNPVRLDSKACVVFDLAQRGFAIIRLEFGCPGKATPIGRT